MDDTGKNTLALGILILVHVAEYNLVICDVMEYSGIQWTKYLYSNDYADDRYVPNETAFLAEVTDPVTFCKVCHINGNCKSFSYQPSTRQCRGCSANHCGMEPTDSSEDIARSMNFSPDGTGPRVRIVDGDDIYEGRLEVFHNGQWGGVCSSALSYEAAKVACRSVNSTWHDAGPKFDDSYTTSVTTPIILNDLACSGSEESLLNCADLVWEKNKCDGGKHTDIVCRTSDYFWVRLVGDESPYRGRLEVSLKGDIWGTVCGDQIDDNVAKVVCRMQGYQTKYARVLPADIVEDGEGPFIFYDYIKCAGSEDTIASCIRNFKGMSVNCDHSQDIGVACA